MHRKCCGILAAETSLASSIFSLSRPSSWHLYPDLWKRVSVVFSCTADIAFMTAKGILQILGIKLGSLDFHPNQGDSLLIIVGSALVCYLSGPLVRNMLSHDLIYQTCHFIFNRWEPVNLAVLALLLLLSPLVLSILLIPYYGLLPSPFIAFSIYHIILVSSIIAYRLSPWHPLARYPGPIAAKTSKWWIVWKERHGKQHLWIRHLHNRYGDVVRIGV